jgi:hypothetical protein|tara:strand:+ start:1134 stop:1382 length:249 start_codon:yes stop_codon:yes gene_type:complete
MTEEEAIKRRSMFFKKGQKLHNEGFTMGQINEQLDEAYDLVFDTSFNTKSGDLGKVRARLLHWIEFSCCGKINTACEGTKLL